MALADSEPAVLETETYRPYHYTTVDSTVQCLTLITITFLRSFKMS